MKEKWVVSVKTSLPNTCRSEEDLKTEIYEFDSFENARAATRDIIRNFAFVQKNEMFDGNGNLTYMQKYIIKEKAENSENILEVVYSLLCDIFAGKDDLPNIAKSYDDTMIAYKFNGETIEFFATSDGYWNGYNPRLKTNMFSMKEPKDYYLYIDDAFGQGEDHFSYASSELYIDLKKENI